jgi:hypothetical protein
MGNDSPERRTGTASYCHYASHVPRDGAIVKTPGAIYYNGFFPGFIGVIPNSAFQVHLNGTEAMLHIVRHVEPVVVTDFGNDFVPVEHAGKHFTALKRPIDSAPTNTIGMTFRAVNGLKPQECFYTKDHDYVVYRKQSFTEITVGAETEDITDPASVPASIFSQAIDEFLQLYRVLTQDVWVQRPDRLEKNVPVIRTAPVEYAVIPNRGARQKRLIEHLPTHFQPIIFSAQEFAKDTPALRHDPRKASKQLGHHLAVGTKLSDAQNALLDCYEMLNRTHNYRFVLVETFSIAEVISFDHIKSLRQSDASLDHHLQKKERKGSLTMGDLIGAFFPTIFAAYIRRVPSFIKNLDITRRNRNATLHNGQGVAAVDAELALNAVQQLIFAIELPSWASFTSDPADAQ